MNQFKSIARIGGFCLLAACSGLALAHGDKKGPPTGEKVVPLMAKDFANIPGKEGMMLTVEYLPGQASAEHRHNAHVFVYVLQGAIQMQTSSGKLTTVKTGETFYENPEDVHTVSRNASKTNKAKFLVFIVKDKGAPPVLPPK